MMSLYIYIWIWKRSSTTNLVGVYSPIFSGLLYPTCFGSFPGNVLRFFLFLWDVPSGYLT